MTTSNASNLLTASSSNYKSHISLPDCSLYFNNGKTDPLYGFPIFKQMPLYSENDIIAQFGFDPLKNLKIPANYKNCFCTPSDRKWYYNYAYFNKNNELYYLTSTYMVNPDDFNSKTIGITISHQYPIVSSIEPIV